MTLRPLGFRRLVFGLRLGAPSRAAELAAGFADLFDVELLGLFIDDPDLRRLAAMPRARAISAPGRGWRELEPALDVFDAAARIAERQFAAASRRLTRRRFEIVRAAAAQALAQAAGAGDIVAIAPPEAAADRAAEPFASLIAAAFDSAASVLLTPIRPARVSGAVVAFAAAADDPSLEAAAAIAAAACERLIVVNIRARSGGALRIERTCGGGRGVDQGPADYAPEAAPQALAGLAERLTVMGRGAIRDDLALRIALVRATPVLSLGPRARAAGPSPTGP